MTGKEMGVPMGLFGLKPHINGYLGREWAKATFLFKEAHPPDGLWVELVEVTQHFA